MPHPDEGLIHAWLDGELDSTDAARVEELVARDPVWAAAAAEARGLIAASSRIAGALDRVPGKVIPRARPNPRRRRWWMTRVAALLLVAVGVVTVVRRPTPRVLTPAAPPATAESRTTAKSPATGTSVTGLKPRAAPAPPGLTDARGRLDRDQAKVTDALAGSVRKESAIGAAGERRADELSPRQAARGRTSADDKASGAAAATVKADKDQTVLQVQARALAPAAQNAGKAAALPLRCFESRQPTDSAKRILRLSVAALADSVRLDKLLERGDSLFDGSRHLVALSVRCPEP